MFKLSEVEEPEEGMTAFSVLVQQQTNKDGSVSRSVELKVYNIEITMETGVQWEVKVCLTVLYDLTDFFCIPTKSDNNFQ